jgi:hypothetical protein
MVKLGGTHILTGTDHLLFLLILLLPAPLLASGGRWRTAVPPGGEGRRQAPAQTRTRTALPRTALPRTALPRTALAQIGTRIALLRMAPAQSPTRTAALQVVPAQARTRTAVLRIARVTLAFTVGHSIALAVSSFVRLTIPAWPVEAFIAASILIGAIHAIRPLFPGREAVVAGVFGLGHGLAFSFVLAEMQLSTARLALSLLGFNLGIELVQLLLVALALPSLLLLSRSRSQPALRLTGALLTAAAATGWLLARLGLPNPVATAADSAGTHTTPMLILLAISAAAATTWTVTHRQKHPVQAAAPTRQKVST